MSIAVSIVSFNTKELLKSCLLNLKSQKTKEKINIWVLDNNSKDGSPEMVKKEFPEVKLIESPENLGFAKGQNKILKQIKDEFVLLLNPDTRFEDNVIEDMVIFMKKNPGCAVSSCKLLDFKGNPESNGGDFPFGLALYSWLFNLEIFGVKKNFHREDNEYYQKSGKVDWVAGTFMFVRTKVFEIAGFLSEDFFMYFEDTEFCYKVGKKKGEVMLNHEVFVKHESGSSSENPRFTQWRGEFSGLIKFYNIHGGFLGGIYVRILVYTAIMLRMLAFLCLGKFDKLSIYGKVLTGI